MIPDEICVRLQSYRGASKREQAERSFYKLVAKRGAYNRMRRYVAWDGHISYTRCPTYWSHGMAVFGSPTGAVYQEWEEQFTVHQIAKRTIAWTHKCFEEVQRKQRANQIFLGKRMFIVQSDILTAEDVPDDVALVQFSMTECRRLIGDKPKEQKDKIT